MRSILIFFLLCTYLASAQTNQLVLNVSLKAYRGQYVTVNATGNFTAMAADGFGAWETFRLFNQTNPDRYPVNGDKIVLQAWNGKYVGLSPTGALTLIENYKDSRCHFTLQKMVGSGDIETNDKVSLKNVFSNKFLIAEGGGGAGITNNATLAREFETFEVKLFRPIPIRVRASNGAGYLSNGTTAAAGSIAIQSGDPAIPASLAFINHSRKQRELRNGDEVSILMVSGRFLQATTSGVNGMANRCAPDARFRINGPAGRALMSNDGITLQLLTRPGYLSRSGTTVTVATATGIAENNFMLEFPTIRGVSGYPDPATITGRPLATITTPKIGVDTLVVFHVWTTDDAPGLPGSSPITRSNTEIQNIINSDLPGLNTWLRANSNNNYGVVCKAVYGPLRCSKAFAEDYTHLLNAAEAARVPLNSYGTPARVWDNSKYKLLVLAGGGLGGQQNFKDATSRSGFRFASTVAGIIVTTDIDKASKMVIGHETSHLLLEVRDRYKFRRPIHGDVITYHTTATRTYEPQVFYINKRSGTGAINNGQELTIQRGENNYVAPAPNAPHYLNLYRYEEIGTRAVFQIHTASGATQVMDGQYISLRTQDGKYVMAVDGGNSAVVANSTAPGVWETFKLVNLTRPGGALHAGDEVNLVSANGNYLEATLNRRTSTTEEKDRKRGYTWAESGDNGAGGKFDNSSVNYNAVLLNLYDRLRLGWVNRKYITPDSKGTYLIRPYIGSGDGFILFDPQNPDEWYTLENRQQQDNVDEIPSSGIIISWVCEKESYWRAFYDAARDDDSAGYWINYPAVISAAAPKAAPNPFAYPPLLSPFQYHRRSDANTAFTNGEVVLPKGDGSPSRFHISFTRLPERNILLTVH